MVRYSVAATFAFTIAMGAASARADISSDDGRASQARILFERGLESIRAERWEEAAELFRKSVDLVPRASSLYNLALALRQLGMNEECVRVIDMLLETTDPEVQASHHEHARTLRAHAIESLVRLELTVVPESAIVSVDGIVRRGTGRRRILLLAPGRHLIEASAPGCDVVRIHVDASAGERVAERLAIDQATHCAHAPDTSVAPIARAPISQDADSDEPARQAPLIPHGSDAAIEPSLPAHWIVLGAGLALLGGAAATGAVAWNADREFVEACPTLRECPEETRAVQSRAQTWATVSTALLGAGLVAGGVGATLWLTATPTAPQSAVRGRTGRAGAMLAIVGRL